MDTASIRVSWLLQYMYICTVCFLNFSLCSSVRTYRLWVNRLMRWGDNYTRTRWLLATSHVVISCCGFLKSPHITDVQYHVCESHPGRLEFIFIAPHSSLPAPKCLGVSLICLFLPFPIHPLIRSRRGGQWPRRASRIQHWCGWIVCSSSVYSPPCLISVEGEDRVRVRVRVFTHPTSETLLFLF